MSLSILVRRARRTATGHWQIRQQGSVYQVVRAPWGRHTTPAYTCGSLSGAVAWIDREAALPDYTGWR